MTDKDLIVDGVIPVQLFPETYGDTPKQLALSPVIMTSELVAQPHPPITVASAEPDAVAPVSRPERPEPASGAARPFFDDLLRAVPWLTTGGSLLGWSKLKAAKHCLRHFFWEYVLGLALRPRSDGPETSGEVYISPLNLGALVHAAIEGFYRTGSLRGCEQVYNAVSTHYPEVALEARRLVGFYFTSFNATERATWDMRTVERESRYYFPARKCGGKRRSLGVSSRVDGAYRLLKLGYPKLPPGQPSPDGVRIHEIKTTGSLGWARLRGFYMDAQLNLQLLTWNHGHAVRKARVATGDGGHDWRLEVMRESNAELVGPAGIVTVTHIGKNKKMDRNKDIDRSHYMLPDERVMQFAAEIGDWFYEEIGERLFSKRWDQPDTWRRDWTCKDQFYPGWACPYLSLCEAGRVDDTMYQRRAHQAMTPSDIELPKALAKAPKPSRKRATADVAGK